MKWQLLAAGSCRHLEAVAFKSGRWRRVVFPALLAVVETPKGWLVVDTGYAPRVIAGCRKGWWRFYRLLLPISIGEANTASAQLAGKKIMGVFLTHFHVDHEGGLRDFPSVPVYASAEGWQAARGLRGLAALQAAHLPELLPDDFQYRLREIDCQSVGAPDWVPTGWSHGQDVLGDGLLWAVPLPGHAAGQLGLMFLDDEGVIVFLVADAIWRVDWLLSERGPRWLARYVTHDWQALQDTLQRIRQLARERPDVRIVPFHCAATAVELGAWGRSDGSSGI